MENVERQCVMVGKPSDMPKLVKSYILWMQIFLFQNFFRHTLI